MACVAVKDVDLPPPAPTLSLPLATQISPLGHLDTFSIWHAAILPLTSSCDEVGRGSIYAKGRRWQPHLRGTFPPSAGSRRSARGSLLSQQEYEREQAANTTGFGRVMSKGDLKLYAICGSVSSETPSKHI